MYFKKKGEHGGKRDSIVTNLELTRFLLILQQQNMDVTAFTKTKKTKLQVSSGKCGKLAVWKKQKW